MAAYFDRERLEQEILAALNLSGKPLTATELTQRCPTSPEQQATSDTLRILKRKQQVQLSAKRWSILPGVKIDAAAVEAVQQRMKQPLTMPTRMITNDEVHRFIIRLLQAAQEKGIPYVHFSDIYHAFSGAITRHRLSQQLNVLSTGDSPAIDSLVNPVRTYKIHVVEAQASLLSGLLDEPKTPRSSTRSTVKPASEENPKSPRDPLQQLIAELREER